MAQPPTTEPHIERPGPAEFRDPIVRREMQKASVWFGIALIIAGIIYLGKPLLLIVGGGILAVFLDGGVRLVGRFLPIPRGWRLLLVLVLRALDVLVARAQRQSGDDEQDGKDHHTDDGHAFTRPAARQRCITRAA